MGFNLQFEEVYNRFFDDKITEIKIIDRCFEACDDKRYYAFISGSKGKKVVIKCYRNNYNDEAKVEGYGYLSKICKDSGINVPVFYKTNDNKYCTSIVLNNEKYLAWCEEYLPYETLLSKREEIIISPKFFYLIGEFVGKIHSATKNKQIRFPWNSSLVLFEGFCQDDEYDENYENAMNFYETLIKYPIDKKLICEIWDLYNKKRNQIKEVYNELPNGGVQGDLSPNNIMVDGNNPVAIIDFNQSGNDVYINDMMQWAVYLVYGYFGEGIKTDLVENLKNYFDGYTQNYSMVKEEIECINSLYNIIRPFRYEMVELALEEAKKGNYLKVNEHLKWVLYEMTRDNIVV